MSTALVFLTTSLLTIGAVPVFRIELPDLALLEEARSDTHQTTTCTTVMDPSVKLVPGIDLYTHAEFAPTLNCTQGTGTVGQLVVDGDGTGQNMCSAACLNGDRCALEMVCSGFEVGVGYNLMAVAATIPGPNHAACFDKSCSGFECDDGYVLKDEAADVPGHTPAVCYDKSCSAFECYDGYALMAQAADIPHSRPHSCCLLR